MDQPLLSVIVPAYNEEKGIERVIDLTGEELEALAFPWEILVVDDGSVDRTAILADKAAHHDAKVRVVRLAHRGKGSAVRRGLLEAHGKWRFLADADLSMSPSGLKRFLAVAGGPHAPHIVIGSREAEGAERIGEPPFHHIASRVFNLFVRALAVPGIKDTQCGYKLFSAEAATAIASCLTIDGFAYDVEMLYLARRAGFEVHELGITCTWHHVKNSRVQVYRGAVAFLDILRVRLNAWRGRYDALERNEVRASPARLERAVE
jgi:glycosyltransferase involved in cell wall biosynthesis